MEWLSSVVAVGLALVIGFAVAWLVVRLRVGRELDYRISVNGAARTLPEVYWAVRRSGVDPGLDGLIAAPLHRRVETLQSYLSEPVEAAQLHERAELLDRELAPLRGETSELPRSTIAFDAAAIALGQAVASNPEVIQGAARATGGILGSMAVHKVDSLPGVAEAGNFMGSEGAEIGAEQMISALDFGVPVGTLLAGGKRMARGLEHGLEGRRIGENVGLDVGLQGGGAVAGGALGTIILPVVGTAIGAAVGGFLGSMSAATVRRRHLGRARDEWMLRLEEVGLSIEGEDFRHLSEVTDESLSIKEKAMLATGLADHRSGWSAWPTYRALFLKRLATVAEQDVKRSRQICRNVRGAVEQIASAEPENRALYWLEMGGPKEGLNLSHLLKAAADYRREYEIAQALG